MKDIAVIIPVHALNGKDEEMLLKNAISNVKKCQANYDGKLNTYIVTPLEMDSNITEGCSIIKNCGETDFCSQINLAANTVKEDYFSILEFDDEYNEKWFSMAKKYYYTNEDVSLFLPINIQIISEDGSRQFGNETPWAMEFSSELGYIDFNCLTSYYGFNITGGIFNRKDFLAIGGLKPSIKVAFNYEFLLRLTSKKLKAFVVPKEGYKHVVDRAGSLTKMYEAELSADEIDKWYATAVKECLHKEENKE